MTNEERIIDPQEAAIVEAARAGDADAYGQLVRAYQAQAYRVAWLICRSDQDAADATQEAFIRAWKALPRFRPGSPFRPWILRIVANQAKNHIRSRTRRTRAETQPALLPLPDAGPDSAVERSADAARVLAALEQLDDEQRLTVYARYFMDLTEAEIAAMTKVRPGTVKSRLARARQRLGELIDIEEAAHG